MPVLGGTNGRACVGRYTKNHHSLRLGGLQNFFQGGEVLVEHCWSRQEDDYTFVLERVNAWPGIGRLQVRNHAGVFIQLPVDPKHFPLKQKFLRLAVSYTSGWLCVVMRRVQHYPGSLTRWAET